MKQPKLLMLGASLAQIPGIQAARQRGIHVISCDHLPHSPGHALADASVLASTFDPGAVLAAARQHNIDGIMTMGSDQPVLTAAIVAQQLDLPSALTVETARAVTDKRIMKKRFQVLGLPTVPFVIYKPDSLSVDPQRSAAQNPATADPLEQLNDPVVIKPVDSQGQRGIFVCETAAEVRQKAPQVLAFSRTDEILVESYYPSDEVTVSGWVHEGQARILTLTDRERFAGTEQLGVCLSHEWPSRYLGSHGDEIASLTQAIVSGFKIAEGPIYFQYLIGPSGVRINEIACRIGGAFESQFIPRLAGFDLTATQIDLALGRSISAASQLALKQHDFRQVREHLSVQLFFAQPCTIGRLTPLAEVLACPGVLDAGYHLKPGHTIPAITNATARVGYCIVTAPDKNALEQRLTQVYSVLQVIDTEGVNQLIHRPLEVLPLEQPE